ncbi:uncharacterized protein [Apostichopus japonicus]|uniref:uncharacterized protein isoform X8 n=1 Tax=Stichopus japonicus TaxID=307972 RepID=UPI003AB3A69C
MEAKRTLRINIIIFGFLVLLPYSTLTQSTSFLDFSFDREPSDTVVASGDTVTLECSVTSTSNPTIEWYKDGVRISNTGVRFSELSDGSLRVGPSNNIAGSYSCSVEDRASNLLLVSREAVVSIATLELISHPVDVTDLYAGDTARFECLAQGQGPLEYVWQRDRANIDLTEERVASRYSLLPSGTLEIQDIRFEDEGSYRCRVISPYGGMQELSREAELVLRRGSASSSRVFEFATEPQSNILLKIGSPVILEVSTTQPAKFRWFKDDAELSFPGDHYTLVGQGSLFIEELQEIHTAIYKVVAESMDGTLIESRTSVLALVPPSFTVLPENVAVREGDIAILPCKTYGIPNPEVVWHKDGDPINIGNDFQIVQGQSLSISSSLISDSGFYQCIATNTLGNVQRSMQLIVVGPGEPLPVLPTLPPASTPTTRTPSTTLQTTTSPAPISFPIDPPSGPVPTMPLRATVSRISSRTAFASWDPPQTTNGEFVRYRVSLEAVNDPSIRTRIISVSQETSKLIRDLRPDTQYRLKVLAINDNGPGENSNPIVFTTEEAVQVPEQPQNLEAMTQSSTSVLVTWQPPIDTFGDLEGYRLYYAKQNGLASREEELLVRGTSTVVEGLDPFTNYGFRVIAVNENGPGESTEATQAQTFSAKPGAPPANFTAEPTSTSSITLRWHPPGTQQNGVITEYRIRYRMVGSKDSKADIKAAGSLRSYIVSELERNNVYEFKIAALTSNGTGPFTEDWLQEYTTDRDQSEARAPGAPSAIFAQGHPDRIEVRWTAPADPDIIVRGYLLNCGKGIPGVEFLDISPSTYRYIIRDVVPDSMYIISLKAYNHKGEGPVILDLVETKSETEAPVDPLQIVFPVHAETESSTAIRLVWADPNGRIPGQNSVYTILYKQDHPDIDYEWNSQNTTNEYYLFRNLNPYSAYVFVVKISRGSQHSDFSMEARNTTFEAVPASAPTGLTVHSFENSTSLLLLWNAPDMANGVMKGYIIYYTDDQNAVITDWERVEINNNLTTATLEGLEGGTFYYIRVQGRNGAGLGPISAFIPGETGLVFIPQAPNIGGTSAALPGTGMAGFPWWLWLIALALVALILLLALLLLLCALCGCFKCCASMCPCCGDVCGGGGCFGQCCQGLARCWVSCCPCCCADEEECAGFCSKLCCGASACCAAGAVASSSNKNGAATAISAGSYKSNGPDVLMSSTTETETDNLIKSEGDIETDFGGSRKIDAMQPSPRASARFSHPSRIPYIFTANGGFTIPRQISMYETDFDITDTSHMQTRSYASGDSMHWDDTPSNRWVGDHLQDYLHYAGTSSYDHSIDNGTLKSTGHDYAEVPSHRKEPQIKKSTGYFEGDRGFIREHHAGSGLDAQGQSITYNTTNVHVAGEGNHRGEAINGGVYDDRSVHSEVRSQRNHGAMTPVTSISTQMVTYPGSVENGADPFTITFEETTTSHSIEKSVPLLDGTNYKTVSNHETHSKSYSTSDASKDNNLQLMLQNGLETGPLAIDIPSTRMEPLHALTAPVYSTNTLGRGNNSSLDSYSSSSHNNQANMSSSVDTNLQSSKTTSNLQTIDTGYRETGDYGTSLPSYLVELPTTLPRPGSDFHTSFEEHSESKVKNYGSGTMPGRVDIATSHMAAADGQVIRSEESKESFPYLSEIGDNALTMSQLDSLSGRDRQVSSSQQYQSTRRSAENQEYHVDGMRTMDSHRSQMADSQYGTGKSSLDFQSSGAYGTGGRSSAVDFQDSRSIGTGKSGVDFQNTGTGYRYSGNASLDRRNGASLGNLAPSRGHMDYHTIDRSEGVDRLENLRRLTNKVLSASSTRLASQNGSGLNAYSSEHLDGSGHSDGYESNHEKRMYHAQSGSSGYQSTGNLLNGGHGQYSFNNNNNSRSNLAELNGEPSSSEHDDTSSTDSRKIKELPKRLPYSQSRDGLVKVSPSPNAHRYLTTNGDLYRKTPSTANSLARSQSIANHIGRDFSSEGRGKSSSKGPSPHQYGDTHRSLMRSYSLDKLNTRKAGYHSDTTLSSGGQDDASVHSNGPNRPGNPNLSSFTVPGPPPPHYQTGPSRVRISAPTYSPLKRTNQPGSTVKVRAQPLPVVTPKAPDVTYRANEVSQSPESTTRTFSTEDLNAEMQHLEGLMKDLNAITASELESN